MSSDSLLTTSDGPDKNNSFTLCSQHQAGVTTGINDGCCCCNPCLYRTADTGLGFITHCCRCNPRMIIISYVPSNGDPCCVPIVAPVYGQLVSQEGFEADYVVYSTTIVGITVSVYLTPGRIPGLDVGDYTGYDADPGCMWIVYIPALGVYEEYPIDHVNVTCLGVPSISVGGVVASDSCVGGIALSNLPMAKIPFQRITYDSLLPGSGESTVYLNYPCASCESVPRFLCFSGNSGTDAGSGYFDFEWDESFTPYDASNGSGYHVGRWKFEYAVPDPALPPHIHYIYLVENVDEATSEITCRLLTDFQTQSGGAYFFDNEQFAPLDLGDAGCGCDFRGTLLSADINQWVIGGVISAGKCGCWKYVCGTCRCLPRYLCGLLYVNGTAYFNVLWTWNEDTYGWDSVSGVDIDGNALTESYNISIGSDHQGECQVATEVYGFSDLTGDLANCGPVVGVAISGVSDDGTDYFQLSASTSFFGTCDNLITCSQATPCADECGSHPDVIVATLNGWNDPVLDEPYVGESCTLQVAMTYWQEAIPTTETEFEINCGYTGFHKLSCTDFTGSYQLLLILEYAEGALEITRWDLRQASPFAGEIFLMDYEVCDPFIAEAFQTPGLTDCPWGCDETIQRFEIEIMEA